MFAAIYIVKLYPGKEAEFKHLWRQIAQHFISHYGALGSCLHQSADGLWIAYSRWPSKAQRDAVWSDEPSTTTSSEFQQIVQRFKSCIAEQLPEMNLEVVEDLL